MTVYVKDKKGKLVPKAPPVQKTTTPKEPTPYCDKPISKESS